MSRKNYATKDPPEARRGRGVPIYFLDQLKLASTVRENHLILILITVKYNQWHTVEAFRAKRRHGTAF